MANLIVDRNFYFFLDDFVSQFFFFSFFLSHSKRRNDLCHMVINIIWVFFFAEAAGRQQATLSNVKVCAGLQDNDSEWATFQS